MVAFKMGLSLIITLAKTLCDSMMNKAQYHHAICVYCLALDAFGVLSKASNTHFY